MTNNCFFGQFGGLDRHRQQQFQSVLGDGLATSDPLKVRCELGREDTMKQWKFIVDDMSSDGSVTCIQMYSMYIFHQMLNMGLSQCHGRNGDGKPHPFRGDHHS